MVCRKKENCKFLCYVLGSAFIIYFAGLLYKKSIKFIVLVMTNQLKLNKREKILYKGHHPMCYY